MKGRGLRGLAVASLLTLATAAHAGPWGAGKGRLYAKLAYGRLGSSELAFPDGTVFAIPKFRKDEGSLHVFYGIGQRFSLIGELPLRSSDLADDPDELGRQTGAGDVRTGLQYQLGRPGPWAFAVRGVLQLPTGDVERADGLLPTGSGEPEGEVALGAGRSLAGGKLYGFVEAGYQIRGGELRDGFVYGAQLGWNLSPRLVLAASVYGVEPWSHAAPDQASGSPIGLGDRVTYLKYGPTAIVKLDERWGVQVDVEGVARARNLAKGVTYRCGLFFVR